MARAPLPQPVDVLLMSEFIGLAYFSEIPTVLIDAQTRRPFDGYANPYATIRSDFGGLRLAPGDTRHVMLIPATPKECFRFTADAFDLAEQLQTPVIVMTDLENRHERYDVAAPHLGLQPPIQPR